jgi:glycosyltransferase involved in cell wall biosynthesis
MCMRVSLAHWHLGGQVEQHDNCLLTTLEMKSSKIREFDIRFILPSKRKRIGGIDYAVKGLADALNRQGVKVRQSVNLLDSQSIFHFHGLWNPLHSGLAHLIKFKRLPYVVSPHGMLEPWAFRSKSWKKARYFSLIEKRFLINSDAIFVTSSIERRNLAKLIDHPNVFELSLGCLDRAGPDYSLARQRLGWASREKFILYLSRIDKKKGLDVLIDAMIAANRSWSGWTLVIVGDGDSQYRSLVQRKALSHKLNLPKLEWVGPVWGQRRWLYFQGADLFCLPTHSENFGLAVLESLHVGTPVLTTSTTPWADYRDLTGLFIAEPTTESIRDSLESAMYWLETCDIDYQRTVLHEWANENFSWDRIAPNYVDAYKKIYPKTFSR